MKQKKKKRKRKIFLPLFLIFFIIIGFYSHQSYETAMHEQLPDSLIEFEQKYPEATGEDAGQLYIKRVIGLPGETIVIKEGVAYLKNEDGKEECIDNSDWWNEKPNANDVKNYQEIVLGDNEYFMMGDNRNHSSDSRVWGAVTRKAILAKAWLRYYKGFKRIK